MPTPEPLQAAAGENAELTLDGLIRGELAGKSAAIARYDAILWKLRSGYIVVLYGLVTVLAGKDFQLACVGGQAAGPVAMTLVAWGVSASAFLVDLGFLLAKLRVVAARNRLADLALALAVGQAGPSCVPDEVRELLHISGEAPTWPGWEPLWNAAWALVPLYAIAPVTVAIVQGTG